MIDNINMREYHPDEFRGGSFLPSSSCRIPQENLAPASIGASASFIHEFLSAFVCRRSHAV